MWELNRSYAFTFYLLLSKLSVLIHSDETTLEVTKVELGTTSNSDLGDLVGVLLKLSGGSNSVINVLIVKSVTRHSKTDKVENTLALFFVLLIPLEGEGTKLARTDTIETDHLDNEADTTKVVDLHVSALEEVSHVKVNGVTTRRHHNTLHTRIDHVDGKLAHLEATGIHVLREKNLTETNSKSESITSADTTVSRITVTENLNLLEALANVLAEELGEALLEETVVTEAEHATHVAETILLGAHSEDIAVAEHLAGNLTEGSTVAAVRLLELLDEPSVLSETSGIEQNGDTSLVSELVDGTEIGHADRLTGSGVVGDGDKDEGDVLSVLGEHGLKLCEIDIALEGILLIDLLHRERIEEVGSEEVLRGEAVGCSLGLSCVEETVGGDHPRLGDTTLLHGARDGSVHKGLAAAALGYDEHVGGGLTLLAKDGECVRVCCGSTHGVVDPPLVSPAVTDAASDQAAAIGVAFCRISGQSIEGVADGVSEGEEADMATDSLITADNAGPLSVAHSSGTTVGEVVDNEHSSREGESVVLGGIEHGLTLLLGDLVGPANDISAARRLNSTELLLVCCRH